MGLALLGGAGAGWMVAMWYVPSQIAQLETALRQRLERVAASTTTEPRVEVVPIERPAASPLYPSAFIARRLSPVVTLVRRNPSKPTDEGVAVGEREVGAAITVTADGWLITTAQAFNGAHVSDLAAVWNGRAYPLTKAIRDQATDVVFLKIEASDLPASEFVHPEDLAHGIVVWLEPRAKRLQPETVLDLRAHHQVEIASSERATRRLLVSGNAGSFWSGGGVWDTQGRLIGLLETFTADGWRVVPASNISGSLASLLSSGEIRHASLGIRTLDLAARVFERSRTEIPRQGAWVRTGSKVLREGDVIERIERDILDGTADVGERLLSYHPGTRVTLTITRQGKLLEVSVILGSVLTSEFLK